jgi:hypothetical protein
MAFAAASPTSAEPRAMSANVSALVLIFGPAAVGKMTVGQELKKLTGCRLLHNHMVIDLVTEFFEFDTEPFHRLAWPFMQQIVDTCADERVGLILTNGPYFMRDHHGEWAAPYRAAGLPVFYVELTAPLEIRLARNETPNRRRHKNVAWATPDRLRELEAGNVEVGRDWVDQAHHVLIDNTDLSPDAAARVITDRFGL